MSGESGTGALASERRNAGWWWLLFGGLVALRLPFIATGHFVDDAYIYFRVAENLAATGTYGFNPGEPVSATTSPLFTIVLAGLFWAFGDAAILVSQGMATALVIGANWSLVGFLGAAGRVRWVVWGLASAWPTALIMSYAGMETALYWAVLVGVLVWAGRPPRSDPSRHVAAARQSFGRSAWGWLSLVALPWLRPDATVVGLVAFVGVWLAQGNSRESPSGVHMVPPVRAWLGLVIPVMSAGLLATVYAAAFGSPLPQTIAGKLATYHPDSGSLAIAARWFTSLAGAEITNIALPVRTKHLASVGPLFSLLAGIGWAAVLAHRPRQATAALCVIAGFTLAYAVGGVVFPWYTWPLTLLLWSGALVGYSWLGGRLVPAQPRTMAIVGALGVAGLVALQGAQAIKRGFITQEFGRAVASAVEAHSSPQATLMLEPAGFIPYVTGRRTLDEVGLVSPEVTAMQARYGEEWWIETLRRYRPDVLVERDHVLDGLASDGSRPSRAQWEWFEERYERVATVAYEDVLEAAGRDLRAPILRRGDRPRMHVYVVRPAGSLTRDPR